MDLDAVLAELLDARTPAEDRARIAAALPSCSAQDVPRVEAALFELALASEGELASACGEALGTLWVRHERLSLELLQQLVGPARELAVGTLRTRRPDWREALELLGLDQPGE